MEYTNCARFAHNIVLIVEAVCYSLHFIFSYSKPNRSKVVSWFMLTLIYITVLCNLYKIWEPCNDPSAYLGYSICYLALCLVLIPEAMNVATPLVIIPTIICLITGAIVLILYRGRNRSFIIERKDSQGKRVEKCR